MMSEVPNATKVGSVLSAGILTSVINELTKEKRMKIETAAKNWPKLFKDKFAAAMNAPTNMTAIGRDIFHFIL